VHYLISAICAERECSQRETTCCQEMHLNSPLRLHKGECKSVFSKTNRARRSKGRKYRSEGAAHAANTNVGRCAGGYFAAALSSPWQPKSPFHSHKCIAPCERTHVLFDLLYLARAKTLVVNFALCIDLRRRVSIKSLFKLKSGGNARAAVIKSAAA
jgi:hypothetical protein